MAQYKPSPRNSKNVLGEIITWHDINVMVIMVMVMLGVHNTLVIWGIGGPRTLEIWTVIWDL